MLFLMKCQNITEKTEDETIMLSNWFITQKYTTLEKSICNSVSEC